MAYCTKCGAFAEDNVQFCTNCGAPMQQADVQPAPAPVQQYAQNAQQQYTQGAQQDPYTQYTQQQSAQNPAFAAEDIAQNKGKAALSYLGILILVPLLAAKDSAFAKFHINQGLLLLIASFAIEILAQIAKWVNLSFLSGIVGLLAVVIFVFRLIGFIWALQGKAKDLPLIGDIKLIR